MATMTSKELVRGIRHGRPLGPFTVTDEVIDSSINRIEQQRLALNTDSPESKALWTMIDQPLEFVRKDRLQQLNDCDIYVLPLPLCFAFAEATNEAERIVVGQGLVDLIAHTVFASYLQSKIPSKWNSFHLLKYRRDMNLPALLATNLFLHQQHFYCHNYPLPDITSIISPEEKLEGQIGIGGAVTFILLHELGHHRLGHLDNEAVRPQHFTNLVNETLNPIQQQEYEADQFALESLLEPARVIGTYWQRNAAAFFTELELVSGERSEEHPLSINRSHYSANLRKKYLGENEDILQQKNLHELGTRFLATEEQTNKNNNQLINTPHESCRTVLKDIVQILSKDLDISPLLSAEQNSWLFTFPRS